MKAALQRIEIDFPDHTVSSVQFLILSVQTTSTTDAVRNESNTST